jgi:flagellin-like protein
LEDTIVKLRHNKSGKCGGIFNDDHAVSPVIAVILMVAITVVMAAIVSSWSSGVKAPITPTTVGLDITRNNYNISVVVTSIDPSSSAKIPLINMTYTNASNGKNYGNIINADVGDQATFNSTETVTGPLIITATFKDNSKKVLYSRDT